MSAFDQDRNLGPDVGVVEEEEEDEEDMEIVKPSFAKRMAEALLASSSSSKEKKTPEEALRSAAEAAARLNKDVGREIGSALVEDGVMVGELFLCFLAARSPAFTHTSLQDRVMMCNFHNWLLVPENLEKIPARSVVSSVKKQNKAFEKLNDNLAETVWLCHFKKNPEAAVTVSKSLSLLTYRGPVRQRCWYKHRRNECVVHFDANVVVCESRGEYVQIIFVMGDTQKTAASYVAGGIVVFGPQAP